MKSEYPAGLAYEVTIGSKTRVVLRPIRPDDAERLLNFHHNLSAGSIYQRYFSVHPNLSAKEVEHLTCVDYVDRFAFVVLDRDEIIAVGRYDRIPGTTEAEVAFLVDDHYQLRGIGLMLLQHLADVAWERGITTFSAETQADNNSMVRCFKRSAFEVHSHLAGGIISLRFPIEPTEASRARRAQSDLTHDPKPYDESLSQC